MLATIRERSGNYIVGVVAIGAIAFMGAFVNQQENKKSELKVERLDFCTTDTIPDIVVSKALKYCLSSPDVDGIPAKSDFAVGSPIEEVTKYREATLADAHDIDWTRNVLPASGAVIATYMVMGYVVSRPYEN